MRDLDDLFAALKRSRFRGSQRLNATDARYLRSKPLEEVLGHARQFVEQRLAAAQPPRDGKQTPWRGHPVFVAQHATATCCRGCLEKWHGIEAGRPLSRAEVEYIVRVLERWLRRAVDEMEMAAGGDAQEDQKAPVQSPIQRTLFDRDLS